jgi:hypothetical protein
MNIVTYRISGEGLTALNGFALDCQETKHMVIGQVDIGDYNKDAIVFFRRGVVGNGFLPLNDSFSFVKPLPDNMKTYLEATFSVVIEPVVQ